MATPKYDLEDLMSEAEEIRCEHIGDLTDALECVSTVETVADAIANLKTARTEALALVKKIDDLLRGD